jgi:hypothetical protein
MHTFFGEGVRPEERSAERFWGGFSQQHHVSLDDLKKAQLLLERLMNVSTGIDEFTSTADEL